MQSRVLLFLLLISCYSFGQEQLEYLSSGINDSILVISDDIENSDSFIKNDSLLTIYSHQWGNHFNHKAEDEKAKLFYLQCIKYGLKRDLFSPISSCYHNYAQLFINSNEIQKAIELGEESLKYAHLAKNKTDIMNSQVLIAKSYKFLGKYQKSNEILFETLDELEDDDHKLKGLTFGHIANNYSHLKSPEISADYHLKAHKQFSTRQKI